MKHVKLLLGLLITFATGGQLLPAQIHKAVAWGRIKKVNELLDLDGSLVHLTDEYGRTPLHFAVTLGRKSIPMINLLLKADADPNAQAKNGVRPLNGAPSASVVAKLVAAGADPNAQDHKGKTPLHYRARNENK